MNNPDTNMLVANNVTAPVTRFKFGELDFKYFPAYAQFILDNKLHEFALTTFRLSCEVSLPLLKLFKSYSEEQLIQLSIHQIKETLKWIAANKTKECIEDSLKRWKNNELPFASNKIYSMGALWTLLASFGRMPLEVPRN